MGILARLVSGCLSVGILFLIRYLLAIPSIPLDPNAGRRIFITWIVMYVAITKWLDDGFYFFFRPLPDRSKPDPYTEVVAEMEAERRLRERQTQEHTIRA
jgi:hypothetical protein